MNDQILAEIKKRVTERSAALEFRHHTWFVKYHIEIVEAIANELCQIYKQADVNMVTLLVWLHDYEKIVNFDEQYNTELLATRQLLGSLGLNEDFIVDIAAKINRYNGKENLPDSPIELQIVSSADAASHFVGPFFRYIGMRTQIKQLNKFKPNG